ncbi:glycoside hydrolase family protein [Limnoraphis robusta Tam1]|uniref:glycoside hydrolase family 24 protein n=1 Tax=Limnoraphis robusta TaxID=1118279 RepID=UPI002B21AEBF|nr:glycoside hydrolase family protein [Limnoraphis robusta]MEA5541967.1 glycoside hydrolase family protein [Limnoraphis robusta Tam1]
MRRTKRTRSRVQPLNLQPGTPIQFQDITSASGSMAAFAMRERRQRRTGSRGRFLQRLILMSLVLAGIVVYWPEAQIDQYAGDQLDMVLEEINRDIDRRWPPLVMEGGDPYVRALMRTISASESNSSKPYHVLYGGRHVSDLAHHPDRCVTIVVGPNKGRCTTAAGRYQLLTDTWERIAYRYHPEPNQFWFRQPYSFEAKYQDMVVYRWLTDVEFWEMDVAQTLRAGQLSEVLRSLSDTWTSLGYGIEDNVMTPYLPKIYEEILQRELDAVNAPPGSNPYSSPSTLD